MKLDPFWQDRHVRFDLDFGRVKGTPGEWSAGRFLDVQDNLGHNKALGMLDITNMRIRWISKNSPRANLSVGWNCIVKLESTVTKTKLYENSIIIHMLTLYKKSSYKFEFVCKFDQTLNPFELIDRVYRSYCNSTMYREVRTHTSIFHDGKPIFLYREEVATRVHNVGVQWTKREPMRSGELIFTNIRILWFSYESQMINLSLPYLQIEEIFDSDPNKLTIFTTRENMDWREIVFESSLISVAECAGLVKSFGKVSRQQPVLGLFFRVQPGSKATDALQPIEDDLSFAEHDTYIPQASGEGYGYYSTSIASEEEGLPCFDAYLGLAVQNVKNGKSVETLWRGNLQKS